MNIIVVGDGKVGLELTRQLSGEGHDLTVVDSDQHVLERIVEEYDVMVVHGNGASMQVLQNAGAESADLLIAATSADEINILTCIIAKTLGTRHTIARVRNPEYSEQLVVLRDSLGLSMTINPELSAATEIYHMLQFPSFLYRETFANGRVEIVSLKISDTSKLRDLPLNKLYKTLELNVLVCAVERDGEALIPDGNFVLQGNDLIHVTAPSSELVKLVHRLGLKQQKIKSVMIVGGSRIAHYLSVMLLNAGISVKIIEQNPERCQTLAHSLPDAMIIEGSSNSQRLLLEEGIREMDALVTLTDIDEENIFLSLYGRHTGVEKVITKISQSDYSDVVSAMGIESPVSPKMLCATEIVRYVRAMANTVGGAVIAMHELVDGKVGALEFRANANTKYLERPLSEVPIKKNFLIACIIRKGHTLIPKGNQCLRKDDNIVLVTSSDRVIVDLNDIFEY